MPPSSSSGPPPRPADGGTGSLPGPGNEAGELTVGVVLPVFQVASYIEECVDSIAAQTVRPAHVVVVDDRGCDDSVELARGRLRRHGLSFEVLTQPANRGLGAARNDGLARLTTDLVWFLDSDDSADPRFIESLRAALVESGAAMATCRTRRVIDDDRGTGVRGDSIDEPAYTSRWCTGREYARGLLSKRYTAYAPTKLFRRRAVPARLWDEGRAYEDFAPMVRLGLSADRVALVNDPLYNYRWRESSLSAWFGPRTCDLFGVEADVRVALAQADLTRAWRADWIGYRYGEVLIPVAHLAMRATGPGTTGDASAGPADGPAEALARVRTAIRWRDVPWLAVRRRMRPLAFAVLVKSLPGLYRAILLRR